MTWEQLYELFCDLNDTLNRCERIAIGAKLAGVKPTDTPAWKRRQIAQDLQNEVHAMMHAAGESA